MRPTPSLSPVPLSVDTHRVFALAGVVVCFALGATAAMHPALVAPVAVAAALAYVTQLVPGSPIVALLTMLLGGAVALSKPFAEVKVGPLYITELGLAG